MIRLPSAELQDIIQKALSSADYAAIAEPKGLFNMDSKRPDGMTTFPYKVGKPLAWDFTCVDTVADSYFHKSSLEAGKTADKSTNIGTWPMTFISSQSEQRP